MKQKTLQSNTTEQREKTAPGRPMRTNTQRPLLQRTLGNRRTSQMLQIDSLQAQLGPGRALPTTTRAFFERQFGRSFHKVRLHTDSNAASAARQAEAKAFNVGNDIVFGSGQYNLQTPAGQYVLAHELSHVAQQRSGAGQASIQHVEAEAHQAAHAVLNGRGANPRIQHDGTQLLRLQFGEPQHLPDRTYIAGQQPQNDGFLQSAIDYHTAWGLRPRTVNSLHQILRDLASGNGRLNRIRIVTHASQTNLFMPFFAGGPSGILEDDLRAFAQGGIAGLAATIDSEFQVTQMATFRADILQALRQNTPNVLQPFGLETTGQPTGALQTLFERAGTVFALNVLIQDPTTTPADRASFTNLRAATNVVLDDLETQVATQFSGQATAADVQTLRQTIAALAAGTIGFSMSTHTFGAQPLGSRSNAARPAVQGTFDTDLAAARARLDGNSWVDIRGCQVGQSATYMEAIALFFATGATQPHVSAPDWFQSFPRLGSQSLLDRQINATIGDQDVQNALNYWSPLAGIREMLRWQIQFFLNILYLENMRALAQLQASRPTLQGGLTLPLPPPLFGGSPVLGLPPPLLTPVLPPLTQPFQRRQFPNFGLHVPPLQTTVRQWAQDELDELMANDAELRMYLEAALVLPVRQGGLADHVTLHYLHSRRRQALTNWLNSQWDGAAPGLAALRRGSWQDNNVRLVAAVSDQNNPVEQFFSPDPHYHQHIVTQ